MTTRTRRNVLTLMGATALSGCAGPAIVSRGDGDPFEGGIGGTGIVGIVTGFGSIRINGLTVEVSDRTLVQTAMGRSSLDQLAPGHSVTIQASRGADGIVARRITQDQLLVGILKETEHGLSVNNVAVRREQGALGSGNIGQRVAVSGVWNLDTVIASRIDPIVDGPDLISGTANVHDGEKASIGRVELQTGRSTRGIDGTFVIASGRAVDGQFSTDRIRDGRFSAFRSLRQISAEGFLEPTDSAPGFRIAGLGHSFARDTRLGQIDQRRAIYFGRYDGLFGASRGYVVPQSLSARRSLLQSGLNDNFGGPVIKL